MVVGDIDLDSIVLLDQHSSPLLLLTALQIMVKVPEGKPPENHKEDSYSYIENEICIQVRD